MSQRTKVTGTRSCTIWLLALIAIVLVVGVAIGVLFILLRLPLDQYYRAGVVFQNMGDLDKAAQEYEKVIVIDADYKDVQTRLAAVKAGLRTATATAVALVQATAAAAPAATSQALEARYQKGLGYMSMGRWIEAKAELEQVFVANPNYKDVQTKLRELETVITKLTPTATPTPVTTPTPNVLENIAPQGEVTASSTHSSAYMPRNAVDGIIGQNGAGEWASLGEQAGAWLRITFFSPRHIRRVVLYDRPNSYERILQAKLSFSDGTKVDVGPLPNAGTLQRIDLPKDVTCTWVQLDILKAEGPNIGLSEIELWGW
jgi:tetratricopeptide (TPR) repeat protein